MSSPSARDPSPDPLAGDARGPTPASLEDAARHHGARVAFLLPAVHNPTGRVLDPGRRQALARTLDKLEITVIEDNTPADLTYAAPAARRGPDPRASGIGPASPAARRDPAPEAGGIGAATRAPRRGPSPEAGGVGGVVLAARRGPDPGASGVGVSPAGRPPSLAALCQRAMVVTVETTSKVAWGGLRIGWLRAPVGVVERSVRNRTCGDLGCSVPAQLLALQLLAHYDALIAARRPALAASAARFRALLTEAIPGCTFDPPAGGLSLWVRLPGGADAAAFASRALRHGVSVAPGLFASPTGGHDHLRLCHDRPTEELTEGIARLAAAWSETPPRARPVGLTSHSRP